jgi:hypothetical protein
MIITMHARTQCEGHLYVGFSTLASRASIGKLKQLQLTDYEVQTLRWREHPPVAAAEELQRASFAHLVDTWLETHFAHSQDHDEHLYFLSPTVLVHVCRLKLVGMRMGSELEFEIPRVSTCEMG